MTPPARAASSPETQVLRGGICSGHAGSWRGGPGRVDTPRRSAGLSPAFAGFDDEHAPATARAWRTGVFRLHGRCFDSGWRNAEQFAGTFEMRLAGGAGEQSVVADAVEALGQDVEQEPADELLGGQRHDLLAVGTEPANIGVRDRGSNYRPQAL